MDTKYRRHLISRTALMERCAIKALKDGLQPDKPIPKDLAIAIRKYLATDEGAKYRPAKPKEEDDLTVINAKYRGSPKLTFPGAVRGLFIPPKTKDTLYVASYIHAMLVRLKQTRNKSDTGMESFESYLLHEAKKYTTPDVAERAAKTILRWVYPTSNEADYFYPTTYNELRRGRKSTLRTGGGIKRPYEVIESVRQGEDLPSADDANYDIDNIVNRMD